MFLVSMVGPVKNSSGELVGYLNHARLNYTEVEAVEVIVLFDRNGLRHGDIETIN